MSTPSSLLICLLIACALPALWAVKACSIEEPAFEVVRTIDTFEIRKYAPYCVAETEIRGEFDSVGNEAFRILAGYIFGGNVDKTKIEMTAPVNMSPILKEGDSVASRLETIRSASGEDSYIVQFVMPAEFHMGNLPKPNDERVHLREIPGRWVAAHRYSGSWSESKYRKKEAELIAALEKENLKPSAIPIFARYNDPFMPMIFRRNEVLVEIEAPSAEYLAAGAPVSATP